MAAALSRPRGAREPVWSSRARAVHPRATMSRSLVLVSALSLSLAACAAGDDDLAERPLVDDLAGRLDVPLGAAEVESAKAGAIAQCPLVDTTAGVTSYRGLAGTYRRYGLVPAGEPTKLALSPVVDHPDARGTYTGLRATTTGWPAAIGGAFIALADNPAIGAVLALDTDGNTEPDTTYFVLGLHRNLVGQIDALCLLGAAPFQMTRSFF
jgi:hypothetical protein